MKVIVSNVLTITNCPHDISRRIEKELTVSNPDYAKKLRMNLWLGDTPKTLSLYEKYGNDLILPFGFLRRLPEFVPTDTEYLSDFPSAVSVDFKGEDVPLYPYQEKAVESVFLSKYGILQSPAGSGKTQMGIALVKKFGKRALWLTHTVDLLNQSKNRAKQYIDKSLIGTITNGKVNIGSGITFATIQTMCQLDMSNYKNMWDVVIVDECHRCAGTPTAVTQFYKVLNALTARHKIGLSATVHRSDGMIIATHALLGEIVYTVPEEAVGDKIMKVGILPVGTDVVMGREALNTDGTLNYQRLITYLCENSERNHVIRMALMDEEGKSCLVLSDRLEHLSHLMKTLPPRIQNQSVMVNGKTPKVEREQAMKDMRLGEKKYLFATYSLAKEGLDIPRLERLFLTTPIKDYAVVIQSIGRIARTFEGKSEPIAYDFVDNIAYLVKAYKQRCRHYKKAGAYFVEGNHGN